MKDQLKMVAKMKKLQKELAKEVIEAVAGDGLVTVQINGEQKIKSIKIDPDQVDTDNIEELEEAVELAITEAIKQSQAVAAEKMRPMMGQLGNLGL